MKDNKPAAGRSRGNVRFAAMGTGEEGLAMVEIHIGDIIQTKKKHPCGSDRWMITRIGADVKIKCEGCGRVVMLERGEFEKKYKKTVALASEAEHDAQ